MSAEPQAAKGEPLSEIETLRAELHLMKTAGVIEVAVRNPSVMEYMKHWERRAEDAEIKTEACTCGWITKGPVK